MYIVTDITDRNINDESVNRKQEQVIAICVHYSDAQAVAKNALESADTPTSIYRTEGSEGFSILNQHTVGDAMLSTVILEDN